MARGVEDFKFQLPYGYDIPVLYLRCFANGVNGRETEIFRENCLSVCEHFPVGGMDNYFRTCFVGHICR